MRLMAHINHGFNSGGNNAMPIDQLRRDDCLHRAHLAAPQLTENPRIRPDNAILVQ